MQAYSVDVTHKVGQSLLYMRYIEPGSYPFASEFPLPSHKIDELFGKKKIKKIKKNFKKLKKI
jgi:hypothetical protein